jgi:cellulose synthase/poly-beta-1,6-N-acetylglucosamine synthase-like glycosyltransferase
MCIYLLCLGALTIYGMHRVALLLWIRRKEKPIPAGLEGWTPTVLVQLPIFNEPHVVARLIDAAARMDWPLDALEIQVLDDSNDHTTSIAQHHVEHWRQQGRKISLIRRENREGYKAGALAHGLRQNDSEFVAIFDADFLPPADFLRNMMPSLSAQDIGLVQARWSHLNRNHNWLTRTQATLLDGHFVIEHAARYRAKRFFNFNGTAGIWRRSCIEQAGGWSHDTVTEDLDLSYRAQLHGWNFVYRVDVTAPAELPSSMRAFLQQQHRWTKGTVQTARKLLGPILRSEFSWGVRLEAVNHLTMVAAYPLVLLLSILLPPSIIARTHLISDGALWIDLMVITCTTGSMGLFYGQTIRRAGGRLAYQWWEIVMAMMVGIGMSPNQTLAIIEGLFSSDATFVRTPKRGIDNIAVAAPKIRLGSQTCTTLMAVYYICTIIWAFHAQYWMSLPFICIFGIGYGAVSLSQFLEGWRPVANTEMDAVRVAK